MIFAYLAKYTMSIFLMRTLFAALLRVGLFKMGIRNAVVHVTLGLSISFIGPIIAASIMKKANGWSFSFIQGNSLRLSSRGCLNAGIDDK